MANTVIRRSAIWSVRYDAQGAPLDAQLALLKDDLIRAANASKSERNAILKPWRKAKPVGRPRTRTDESEPALLASFESFRDHYGPLSDIAASRLFYRALRILGLPIKKDTGDSRANGLRKRISAARTRGRSSRK